MMIAGEERRSVPTFGDGGVDVVLKWRWKNGKKIAVRVVISWGLFLSWFSDVGLVLFPGGRVPGCVRRKWVDLVKHEVLNFLGNSVVGISSEMKEGVRHDIA